MLSDPCVRYDPLTDPGLLELFNITQLALGLCRPFALPGARSFAVQAYASNVSEVTEGNATGFGTNFTESLLRLLDSAWADNSTRSDSANVSQFQTTYSSLALPGVAWQPVEVGYLLQLQNALGFEISISQLDLRLALVEERAAATGAAGVRPALLYLCASIFVTVSTSMSIYYRRGRDRPVEAVTRVPHPSKAAFADRRALEHRSLLA